MPRGPMRIDSRSQILLFCLLFVAPCAMADTTLNMSHDLVALGIASRNLTPNDASLDARPLFQAAIGYVQTHPVTTLTLDSGNYYLLTEEQSNAVLIFPNLSNMTIDLAGSTFYFEGPLLPNGLQLYYCTNVTLTNFKLDYLHPPYTHVKLASVDPEDRVLKYQLLSGWPDPSVFNTLRDPFSGGPIFGYYAAIFRNGAIVPGTTRTLLQAPFENETLTVADPSPWAQSATLATLRPGDTVVVTTRGGGSPILVWESSGITLSDIAIYGSPDWAVQLFQVNNTVVDSVNVMPRPGTGLIGSDADGIHFFGLGANNQIKNCSVKGTMDDALIMENDYAGLVTSQEGPRTLTVNRNAYLRFANGTSMNFVDPGTTLVTSGGTLLSQDPPDSDQPVYNGPVTLTFDRNLPTLAPGKIMVFGSPDLEGQGSVIEDNLVEGTYSGRGVWLSGVHGVTVERNVLRNTSMAGIGIIQETDETGDPGDLGPPSSDVVIADNALEGDLGPAACGTGIGDCLGALLVESVNDQSFGFASSPGNSGITMVHNYIADTGRSGVWLGEVNGGNLEDNMVIRSNRNPTLGGLWGIPPPFQQMVMQDAMEPVVVHYSAGVVESSNTVETNSTIAAPVTIPASVTLPASAGFGIFPIKTALSGFGWKASSDSPWLVTDASGTGNGTVTFSVTANSSISSRSGHITVAGETVTVVQQCAMATYQ
jgi:Putative binding domain, N-terminal